YPRRPGLRGRCDDLDIGAGDVVAGEAVEEHEPVAQEARREEATPHVLLPRECAGAGLGRVGEDLETGPTAVLRGVDEPAGLAVVNLGDDAADVPSDHRPALPQRL